MEPITPLPRQRGIHEWADKFRTYGDDYKEIMSPNELDFTCMSHAVLNFISDWHIGHPSTHVDRITQEVELIARRPNSFALLLGDMVDNMNWNPGQFEQKQTPEQILYFRALLDYLADKDSLLLYVQGDHDGWLMKAGYDPKTEVLQRGAHATNGPTHLNIHGRDFQKRIGVAHQLPGHSIYNDNHPQRRALNVGGAFHGADVVVSGHNHKKSLQRMYVNEWGETKPVDLIALGAYKPTDSWLKKKGFRPQGAEQMYGASVIIDALRGDIYVYDDILEANK